MRLICPNCGAQYEVPNDVIPQDGRDVQCSSCGHTWFQKHPAEDAGLAEELEQPLPEPDWQDEEWPDATAEPEPHPDPEPDPQPRPEPEAPEAAPAPEPGRRPLDPEVARLLREEAEQEARARAAEAAGGLESQPDLGLDANSETEQARRAREARERMARMRGEEPETATSAAALATGAEQASRRDRLPDIDQIKSTLRASDEPRGPTSEDTEHVTAPARGGFGRGFALALLVGVILVALYVLAPRLSEDVPALAPALDGYASAVDRLRVRLDEAMMRLLTWMEGLNDGAA